MISSFPSRIIPPVGKSGPITISDNCWIVELGLSTNNIQACSNSIILCGGILVAIPTAIPEAPFAKRCGKLAGSTVGSLLELS